MNNVSEMSIIVIINTDINYYYYVHETFKICKYCMNSKYVGSFYDKL